MRMEPGKIDTAGRIVLIIILAAFGALMTHKTIVPYFSVQKELIAFEDAVSILSDAEGSVNHLNSEIQYVLSEIAKSEALIPADLNLDVFLDQLDGLARRSGAQIEELTPRAVREHRLCRELPLEVQVSGPFNAIYNFLIDLEYGDRLARVEQFEVKNQAADGSCRAEMQIALYFLKGEQQ